jgi:TFIIF-interacting CTD phosphatase-like protein
MVKQNFLLDLDQTIICSEPIKEFEKNRRKYESKMEKFDHDTMTDEDTGEKYYIVFSRPHLQEFLTFLFQNFNVSVWTAATKDYAMFIIDKIVLADPDRKLDYVFFSYHCDFSKKNGSGTKDLSLLENKYRLRGYNSSNTIILDDNVQEVCSHNPKNCIVCPEFQFTEKGSENDTFLVSLEGELKKILGKDVTEYIPKINGK